MKLVAGVIPTHCNGIIGNKLTSEGLVLRIEPTLQPPRHRTTLHAPDYRRPNPLPVRMSEQHNVFWPQESS